MEKLERRTFEHYADKMQTGIGLSTPEEMRWLAMFPKVMLAAPKELTSRFAAVAVSPATAADWIDGPLSERLAEAVLGPLAAEPPMVLMTLRGRLYLRLELDEPEVATVAAMVDLFETAAAQAVRVAGETRDSAEAVPSVAPTTLQTHFEAEDETG
jgi:D-aminopeptidase